MLAPTPLLPCADGVNEQNSKVLVYCMTGVTRWAQEDEAGGCAVVLHPAAAALTHAFDSPAALCLAGRAANKLRCKADSRPPLCARVTHPPPTQTNQHRSPSVVIAYLMKMRGWRLAESYKWVKDKRPQTKISEGGWTGWSAS
jgi:hypothetical protein